MQEIFVVEGKHVDALGYQSISLYALDNAGTVVRKLSAESQEQTADKLMNMYRGLFVEKLKLDGYKVAKGDN